MTGTPRLLASDVAWPPLPLSGFVAPRVATAGDVEAGNAVFSMSKDGDVGRTAEIDVPQYAFYLDGPSKVPAIVLQAEYAVDGALLIGGVLLTGEKVVGFDSDFERLGTNRPN